MATYAQFITAKAPTLYHLLHTPVATYFRTPTRSYITTFMFNEGSPLSRGQILKGYSSLVKTLERAESARVNLATAISSRPHFSTGPARRATAELKQLEKLLNSLMRIKVKQQALFVSLAGWEAAASAPEAYTFPWSAHYGLPQGVDFDALVVAGGLEARLAKRSVAYDLIESAESTADILKPPPGYRPELDEPAKPSRLPPWPSDFKFPGCKPYSPPADYVPVRISPRTTPSRTPLHVPPTSAARQLSLHSSNECDCKLSGRFAPNRRASLLFRLKKKLKKLFQRCHRPSVRPETPDGYRRVDLDNWPKNGVEDAMLDWAAGAAAAQIRQLR